MTYQPRSKVDLGHGRGWLARESAESIWRIDKALGHPLQITEAGREWDEQNAHYQRYRRYLNGGPVAPIALHPDTPSVHQEGDAIDSNEAQQYIDLMARNGWIRTVYRYVNGKWTLVEVWHFEHFPEHDQYRNQPSGGGSNPFPTPEPKPTPQDRNGQMNEEYYRNPDTGEIAVFGVGVKVFTENDYKRFRVIRANHRKKHPEIPVIVPPVLDREGKNFVNLGQSDWDIMVKAHGGGY